MSTTTAAAALRDLADRAEESAAHHAKMAQSYQATANMEANKAHDEETNAQAYREAAAALEALHSAGATLEGATCPSDCAARHPGREHEWITTHLPHNDDV